MNVVQYKYRIVGTMHHHRVLYGRYLSLILSQFFGFANRPPIVQPETQGAITQKVLLRIAQVYTKSLKYKIHHRV